VVPVYETNPGTGVEPCIKMNVAVVIVVASIVLLKVAVIFWLKGTLVSALAGSVEVTTGGVITTSDPVVKLHS